MLLGTIAEVAIGFGDCGCLPLIDEEISLFSDDCKTESVHCCLSGGDP